MKTTTSHLKEIVMQGVFTACACISILAVALICIFLFANGLPTIFEIGPLKFLLGTTWKPGNNLYGILPMILGSIYVTAGAIIVGVPIGLLTAIYMSRFASPRINKVLLPAVQLLAGGRGARRRRLRRGRGLPHRRRHHRGGAGYGQIGLFQNCAAREKRQGHEPVYRQPAAGHHDFAHHHHGQQNQPGRCAPKLLRGQPGSGCYP